MSRKKLKKQNELKKALLASSFLIIIGIVIGARIKAWEMTAKAIVSPVPEGTVYVNNVEKVYIVQEDGKNIDYYIDKYSEEYKVNKYLLHYIIFKESSYNPEAVGDNGKAVGLAQFHPGTWQSFRQQMGLDENINLRKNSEEAIRTLAWGLANNYHSHWTAYKNGSCR